jgi:hypothetical protein
MDYGCVTKKILKLANKSTVWTFTIQIQIGDNESHLDISSAARGELSVTPDGATKQPNEYPTGSFHMFDPDLYGENSWEKLKEMLTNVGCVSWCSIVIHNSSQKKLSNRKQLIYCVVIMGW